MIYELLDGLAVEGLTKSPVPASASLATNGNHIDTIANGNHSNGDVPAVATA